MKKEVGSRNAECGKMKLLRFLTALLILFFAATANAADVSLSWDASPGATGYRIYQSVDQGIIWSEIGDVTGTSALATGIADTGLVLFRISAYNTQGESVRTWSGAWYNGDWRPIDDPGGAAVE